MAKWTPTVFKMLMLNKHCGGARGGSDQRDLTKEGKRCVHKSPALTQSLRAFLEGQVGEQSAFQKSIWETCLRGEAERGGMDNRHQITEPGAQG